MSKFKVGDRVVMYNGFARHTGVINSLVRSSLYQIKIDSTESVMTFHEKQCRKLVKKERRRVWVDVEALRAISEDSVNGKGDGLIDVSEWIEFTEVRRK